MPFDPSSAKLFEPESARLVEEPETSTMDKIKGLGEVALALGTGAVGGGLGTLSGTIAGLRQYGLSNPKAVEEEAARQAESLTYAPRTKTGQEYMEPVGEFVNRYVVPAAPWMAELEGAATAGRMGKQIKRAQRAPEIVPEAPASLADIVAQAEKAPENQRVGPPTKSTFDPTSAKLIEEPAAPTKNIRQMELPFTEAPEQVTVSPSGTAMTSPEQVAGYEQFGRKMETPEAPPQAPLTGQGDLFMNEEVSGPVATPYNAAERGALPVEETANPALARRQMELQLENQTPIYVSGDNPANHYLSLDHAYPVTLKNGTKITLERTAESPDRVVGAPGWKYNPDEVNQTMIARDEHGNQIGRLDFMPGGQAIESWVEPEYRRMGIGTLLYDAAETHGAVFRGTGEHLGTVSREAQAVRQFRNQREPYRSTATAYHELPEQVRTITEDAQQVEFARQQAEAKARELQAKQAVESGQTGNLFADYVNQHRPYELFRDENGQPLSRAAFNETVDNLAKERSTGYVRPEDMDQAYAKYLENFGGVQAGLFDQPTTAMEMAKTLKNDAAARMRDNHPLVKAAEKFVNQEQQFLDQLKQQGATAEAIADAARDVAKATERLEKTKENVAKGLSTGKPVSAIRRRQGGLGKQQGGATTTEFLTNVLSLGLDRAFSKKKLANTKVDITPGESKNKFLPQQVKQGLSDYTKERRSAEDIKTDIVAKNIPDMKATPLSDKVQAGGLYKQLETNNPIVRKTFAAVSDADHRAKANIRTLIQDPKTGLPALFRKLTKSEAGDWWAVRQMTEGEMDLSPAQMKAAGMNDKQIAMNEAFKNATDFVFDKINQARELAGKAPIDKRVGYMAGQASGDFRRLVYKRNAAGEKEVIGVIGSDIRAVLDRRVAKLLEANPEWEVGNEQVGGRGRRESRQKAFEDAVEMLAENNPATKELMDTYDNILRKDAYDYMNAKKHTMQKKGVFGTEGFKRDVDAWTNAKEGMASQIRYLEKMINWAEMSKAVDEVKPLLTDDTINMPNAKKWSSDYIDRALGIQTSEVGAAIDGLIGAVGKGMGVGPSAMERGVGRAKSVVSKYLLGFVNPVFLAINMVQPAVATPAINALLTSRGIKLRPGTLTRGAMDYAHIQLAERFPDRFKLDSFQKDLLKEGHERNIFGSEIFEHVPHLRKSGQIASNIAEYGISSVEGATRGSTFTAYAKALKENGYKGKELFDIAENLTNQVMTDYRNIEAPSMYKELGALGDISVTLQRYKHNSMSNLAMLAREAKNNKNYKPIAVALGAMLATSGLTGMLGFNEADALYQQYTKHFTDKPDTLTRLLLDNAPDTLSYGAISTLTNLDMSKRFGMALSPDSVSGALFPGASRLVEPLVSGANAVMNPTDKTQWQRFARDIVPNSARGVVDRAFFETPEGLAINPKEGNLGGTVMRNEVDKRAKLIGGTGLHESKEKARLYQEQLVDKAYTAKRQGITNKVLDDLYNMKSTDEMREYFHNGKGKQMMKDYTDAEGDIGNLVKAVEKFRLAGKTTAMQRKQMAIETASPKQAKRYAEMTRNANE